MKKEEHNKGITLIALVITIIVLLILVGVTISTLTGDNGLFAKTTEAGFKSEIKQYEEELRLKIGEEEIETLGNRTNTINVFKNFPSTKEENENFEEEMKENIPSFNNSKYGNKLEIRNDELIYTDEENEKERKWFSEVNLSLEKYLITVNYADKQGNILAESETISTITGLYEIEPKVIEGYEAERPLYIGKTKEDTEITITYIQESGNLAYIGLDQNGNETDDESKIVTYSVTGIGNFTGEDLVIPRTYKEKTIVEIKKEAFKRNIIIKNLIIPNTVKKVGDACFESCTNLETVNLNALKLEGSDHFENTKLNNVIIGKNVEQLGNRPFYRCSNLANVLICTEKADINAYVFNGCKKLKEAMTNEENLKYKIKDGVLYSKDEKIIYMYPPGKERDFTITENVEELYKLAFFGNSNLNNITIPNTVKKVGDACFESCTNLETVNLNALKLEGSDHFENTKLNNVIIGKNVEQLGNRPFYRCSNLANVLICTEKADINAYVFNGCKKLKEAMTNEENLKYKVKDGVLYSKDEKIIYMYPPGKEGDFTITENVEELYKLAFYGNSHLNSLDIPNTVKKVGDNCFEACVNLEEVNLNALNLEGYDHFRNTKLNNITVGKDVKKLGDRPFYQCSTINEINYLGTIDEWNSITKSNLKSGCNITKIICTNGTIDI